MRTLASIAARRRSACREVCAVESVPAKVQTWVNRGVKRPMTSLRQQLRDNAVALISLVVALGSQAYNTWRNERTEHNRNVRTAALDRKSTRLNSSHSQISYAVFCLKKKKRSETHQY